MSSRVKLQKCQIFVGKIDENSLQRQVALTTEVPREYFLEPALARPWAIKGQSKGLSPSTDTF